MVFFGQIFEILHFSRGASHYWSSVPKPVRLPYDANAKVLQPEQVKDVCIRANLMQVDAEYTTDLTHVNMLHAGLCELPNVFTWTDDFSTHRN